MIFYIGASSHLLLNISFFYRLSLTKISFMNDVLYLSQILIFSINILLSGDVEANPGPGPPSMNIYSNLSVCHWNAGSLPVHNFVKIDLIKAFNSVHNFDIIFITETFLNSSHLSDNNELLIENYTLIRADHPSDVRRGGVCVYYKSCLPVRTLQVVNLKECLALAVQNENKLSIFCALYRLPSQLSDDFEKFVSDLELDLNDMFNLNPFVISIFGDFNAKSSNWWDGDNTSKEGIQIDSLASLYGFHQLISEPTHIINNSRSCIDLVFTTTPNLVTHSGVYPSLHENCHHLITFAIFDLQIEYPPPYERLVWNYEKANTEMIQRALSNFHWENSFANIDIDEKVNLLNNVLINVFTNFCPFKKITCNDNDPPWLNEKIKELIRLKNTAYIEYKLNHWGNLGLDQLTFIADTLNQEINIAKENYYHKLSLQLNDPLTRPKKYWSILKTLLNGKKIPLIPPLFINSCFVSNFKEKAQAFNSFFALQCTHIENGSQLPNTINFATNDLIHNINFSSENIKSIIQNLNINKAHGYDGITVRMIKICGESICKPLELIFRTCIDEGIFPNQWKKANGVPIHKKNEKNLVKYYRPMSLLPIFSKIFERLIFDSIAVHLSNNNLLSPHQSGFRTGDSCTNQLIYITHKILSSLESSHELRGVFLDMSKAFDKVWHKGLIFKLKRIGVSGKALLLLESFLSNRKQRVVLNGQNSDWLDIEAGVPQGSILGPLFFLIYINDIPDNLISHVKLFADDISLFSEILDPVVSASNLNNDLKEIENWSFNWRMEFNPDPLKQATEVLFTRKKANVDHPNLNFNGAILNRVSSQKHLGLILDDKLSFNDHISFKLSQARKGIANLRRLFHLVPRKTLITIYKSFIRPYLDYCDIIYSKPNNNSFTENIESVQYNAALAITGAIKGSSKEKLYQELGLERLSERRWINRLSAFYKILNTKAPAYLFKLIPSVTNSYQTRSIYNIPMIYSRTEAFKYSFIPNTIFEWNNLDATIKNSKSLDTFKSCILKFVRPKPNLTYSVFNPLGMKHLTRLRLGLSHLREHKFKHNFQDTINPTCNCSLSVESNVHFFLHCQNFSNERQILLNNLSNIDIDIANFNDNNLVELLLYGSSLFDDRTNNAILTLTISFILATKRFEGNLF